MQLLSQESTSLPISLRNDLKAHLQNAGPVDPVVLEFPKAALQSHQKKYQGSPIISYPVQVQYNSTEYGKWYDLPNGGALWKFKINSPNAKGLALFFTFHATLPGAQLQIYDPLNPNDQITIQPFDLKSLDHWSGIRSNASLIVEYFFPRGVKEKKVLSITRVDHVYEIASGDSGFLQSEDCHANVNCPNGDDWENEKKGIVRIQMVLQEGVGFCSGNLMNNTSGDGKPYILSAYHCQDGFTPVYNLWFFDFGYAFSGCDNESTPPTYLTIPGCVQRAGRQENDILLLELNSSIPASFGAYFLGWDRSETPPSKCINIHHPMGDVKKITLMENLPSIFNNTINWDNDVTTPIRHHFEVIYNEGTFEIGSSGSALINAEGRVIGQLHGGFGQCNSKTGFFGRLTLAWEGGGSPETRLKDWLDPMDSGVFTLDGMSQTQSGGGVISGSVVTQTGRAIPGITIQLAGAVIGTAVTDANGTFRFSDLPLNQDYLIDIARSDESKNGVSIQDIIRIRKHVLNITTITDPYQLLAGDVDNSQGLSVVDIVKIQKVLLNIDTTFEGVPDWQYIPAAFQFTDDTDPWQDTIPSNFAITNFNTDITNVHFIGIKTGDLNDNANLE